MLKAIYSVFNFRLFIILTETIIVLKLYKMFSIKIDIDLTILSIAIVFPLVFSCLQDIENGLHIKSHPHVSIEKPFSKTHAPVLGLGVPEKF